MSNISQRSTCGVFRFAAEASYFDIAGMILYAGIIEFCYRVVVEWMACYGSYSVEVGHIFWAHFIAKSGHIWHTFY